MKRLLFLPPLALLLLLLSCDGRVPSEPSADASTPNFAKATQSAGLHADCPTCTLIVGANFYTGNVQRPMSYDVCPATKGVVQVYRCYVGGTYGTAEQCESGEGSWEAQLPRKNWKFLITPTNCTNGFMSITSWTTGIGFQLRYKPRGSGYYPETYSFTVYSTSGP